MISLNAQKAVNMEMQTKLQFIYCYNLAAVGANPEVQIVSEFVALRVWLVRLTDTDRQMHGRRLGG